MRQRVGIAIILVVALGLIAFFWYRAQESPSAEPTAFSIATSGSQATASQPSAPTGKASATGASPVTTTPDSSASARITTLWSTVAAPPDILLPNCRFAITAPFDFQPEEISALGVGGLLDWRSSVPSLPEGVEYVPVLRLRDDLYSGVLSRLAATLGALPAAAWVVGNEPDTVYAGQDGLTAEVYAQRFFDVATRIRELDPQASIGFGTIVQPTPLRLRYLQRAWEELIRLAGSSQEASALVDFWSIHAFILNEWPDEWGSGVPPGFEEDYDDAMHFNDFPFAETYNAAIFAARVEAFRAWMVEIGERDKPLWITEYGSLFPPEDPAEGPDLVNVVEAQTNQFMYDTFDFLLTAANLETGMPADEDRLVQRWFWYSLNDHLYSFGGSLYNPDNDSELTRVGMGFIAYLKGLPVGADVLPVSASIAPAGSEGYRLEVRIANAGSAAAGAIQVSVYDGDPASGGRLLGEPQLVEALGGCSAQAALSFDLEGQPPESVFVVVSLIGGGDLNRANDQALLPAQGTD